MSTVNDQFQHFFDIQVAPPNHGKFCLTFGGWGWANQIDLGFNNRLDLKNGRSYSTRFTHSKQMSKTSPFENGELVSWHRDCYWSFGNGSDQRRERANVSHPNQRDVAVDSKRRHNSWRRDFLLVSRSASWRVDYFLN